ncbi:hypothetical protein IscW_ISCW003971 [Ixodes scapularis]|uniref:Uncharacterized protein n=1 Tax=Ixodes scapularis TaxID=6945 RepID=B7PFD5_IXOSC|nr:hypothetical protein IscW_ISCW003971 [Ixodes scapularis]|eukprot:XP_002433907.1 hypothetical protein IscW_ISCW003971 [Ixodes scapularis]
MSVLISVSPPQIDILHMDDVLSDDYSLMDVAYIYAWKRGPASPSPHRREAASSPAVSLYQKPAVAVNQAATPSPLSQQHHHHHNHHRSSSRGFLKGANLTCINPDPDAFHPRIVIKNLPPRASGASFHRM